VAGAGSLHHVDHHHTGAVDDRQTRCLCLVGLAGG
jgi:hypothetical protein